MSIEDIIRDTVKQPKIPDQADGVVIEDSNKAREIDWEDVKIWKKPSKIAKPIDKWITADFVCYCRYLHFMKYDKDWRLSFQSACAEILRLKDKIIDCVGYCDNILLKRYIEYHFENKTEFATRRTGLFLMAHMMEYDDISRFYRIYEGSAKTDEKKPEPQGLDPRQIENVFLLSQDRLVAKYGILIAVHYLSRFQSFTVKDASKLVFQSCHKMHRNKEIKKVIEATEQYNPYPKWIAFDKADALIKKIDRGLSVEVKLAKDNKKFSLLKR